jgi:hypothetical protein
MQALGQLVTVAFYAVMVLALLYFLHKVLWFVQFRRLQMALVERALQRMSRTTDATLLKWDQRAGDSWSETSGAGPDSSPEAYISRVEGELAKALAASEESLTPLRDRIVDTVLAREVPERELVALEVHRLRGEPMKVAIDAKIPAIVEPTPPSSAIFELEVRSRYGLKRRLLAFFLGAADVVYSANHVARMSQNVGLPLSVILRRSSLIVVILLAIAVDVSFGVRPWLVDKSKELLGSWAEGGGFFAEMLPAALGLTAWLAAYGVIYVGLFVYLFKRSLEHRDKLKQMQREFDETLAILKSEHRERLGTWAREYGGMLDEAARAVLRQAVMLYERSIDRVRRRLASPELLTHADRAARAFFVRLPESSQKLDDVATMRTHSLRHLVWPRQEEMEYQVRHAQYRAAFRHLDMVGNELRGPNPDAKKAQTLWRSLVAYARMFPEVLPEDFRTALKGAYDQSLEKVVENTERDLAELDRQLTELADGLRRTFLAAGPLIESRVELESESIHAELARYVSSVVRVREQARLEAMAFEI